MCKEKCFCRTTNDCDRFTGKCSDEKQPVDPIVVKGATQRIGAKEWIKVDQHKVERSLDATDLLSATNSLKLNALNSTIKNLTENIERLSKQVEERSILLQSDLISDVGGVGSVPVILEHYDFRTTSENNVELPIYNQAVENNLNDYSPIGSVIDDDTNNEGKVAASVDKFNESKCKQISI